MTGAADAVTTVARRAGETWIQSIIIVRLFCVWLGQLNAGSWLAVHDYVHTLTNMALYNTLKYA